MDTKDAQDLMRRVYLERDKARGMKGTLHRTFQELEELNDAILNNESDEEIAGEVADVLKDLDSFKNSSCAWDGVTSNPLYTLPSE